LGSDAFSAAALNHKADVESTLCVIIGALMIHFGGPGWAAADDMAAILIGTL
tara:strand:+ start:318 stop:473 length:156 start_codon:yes stop_codon:yes gene_type:complete